MRPFRIRPTAVCVLGGIATFVNYRIPSLSGEGRALAAEGLFLISFGTVWAIGRYTDSESKPAGLELFLIAVMILGPFVYLGLQLGSATGSPGAAVSGFFKAIYQSSPQLLVACALGLIPTVVERIRRQLRGAGVPEHTK